MKKKTYILTFLMMLCSFVFGQGCPWTQPSHFENTMTVSGRVLIQGEWVLNDDASSYTLGAFCGNELRGVIPVSEFNTGTQITIGGENGQSIIFKLWDDDALSVLEYSGDPITFVTNNIITMFDINFTSKNHWNPSHNTNSNMTITAHVTINGDDVAGDYEIGAFIGDNVCGSARVNNSIAYIVISHNEEDGDAKVTFKLWNHGANPAGLTKEITDVTVNYEHNATYGSQENPFVINFNEAVAEVAGEEFATLQAAVNATTATNTEVKVLRDFALDNTVTIANNQTVVLNLDGKTISQEKACTASYSMINNKGNLTITGNGKLSFKDTGAGDSNFGWGSYTISNNGTLVVENGTIEHLGTQTFATHCIMAIYQYSGSTTIKGGTISTPNYRSARLWKGNMTIKGGTFDGQVWVQAVDNSANLTINGGTFEPNGGDASAVFVTNNQYKVELNVTDGTFNGKIGTSDANKEGVKGSISGGTFSATAKEGTNVALLQDGYVFKLNDNGTYGVVPGLNGSGTEDDPFIIKNMVDLTFFRDYVNSGGTKYNAPGVYVALDANIDMAGTDWSVNIGDNANNTFDGIFDGKGFTLSNLKSTETSQKSDGYVCTGLFGAIAGDAVVKNLTIENVDINTANFTGNNVAAVVGWVYTQSGKTAVISNVTVEGDVKINATGIYGVGAIVGYSYPGGSVNVTRCKVLANDGSVINAISGSGAIIGYCGGNATIKDCVVDNIDVTAQGLVGGVAGIVVESTSVLKDNTVKNATLTATKAQWVNGVAVAVGTMVQNGLTVDNTTSENVNVNNIVGSVYAEQPTSVVPAVEARIDNKYYKTLEDALAAANENDIITLLVPYTVEAGETLTIDKKVTYSSNVLGEAMITNKGTLTITGSVDYTYTGQPDATYSKGNYTINNSGTLTVNGNVENKTDEMSHASYAINTNAGATLNVESGNVLNLNGHAIRMVSFGTAANNVNINGGYIEGTRAIWVQLPSGSTSTAKPEMNLAISGGELKSNEVTNNLAIYVYSYGQSAENLNINITGGTFSGNVAINDNATNTMKPGSVNVQGGTFNGQWGVYSYANDTNNTIAITGGTFKTNYSEMYAEDNGYIFVPNAQGTSYTVTPGQYVAKIGEVRYASLAAAIAKVQNDETIELITDCAENVTIAQNKDTSFTIDGKDKIYAGTITIKGDNVANNFYNTETLTFKNINFTPKYGTYAITAESKGTYERNITVYGCTFNGNNDCYGIRVRNGYNYTVKNTTAEGMYTFFNASEALVGLTVENVTVKCSNVAFSGAYGKGDASFKNVIIDSENNGVKVNNPNGSYLTFEDCSITAKTPVTFIENAGVTSPLTAEFKGTNTMVVNNGGTYWFNIVEADATDATFKAIVNDADLDMSNTAFEASVGNVYYNTLQNAIKAAVDGETVKLNKDIELDAANCVTNSDGYSVFVNVAGKAITIDLNGKAVTANLSADQFTSAKSSLLMAVFSVDTNGNLTLNDSKGTGKVAVTANDASVYSLISNYDSSAKLTINGGSYELDKAIAASSLIHSDPSEAVIVNGGNFYLGNVDTGANNSPWIFNVNGNNTGHVIVNGGTFNYDINHQYWAFEVYVPKHLALKNNGDGTWTVVEAVAYVNETNVDDYTREAGYATLEEALASKYGNDVTMLKDVELASKVTIDGKNITLDLNSKTISGKCNAGSSSLVHVKNNAALTIMDGSDAKVGKLTYAKNTSDVGWTVYVEGALTLKSGTIELTGNDWSIGYAVDVRPNAWGTAYTNPTVFKMNGGNIVSSDGGVRVASTSYESYTNITSSFEMNGGTIDAAWDGVFVQQSNAIYDVLSFTMEGGTINSDLNPVRVYGPAATDYVNGQNCMNINFLGGNMNYTGTETQTWVIDGILRVGGGSSIETILESGNITASEAFAQANKLPEGYAWADNNDGTFSATSAVAKIGDNYYSSLQGAVNAAQDGDEITVIKDFTVTTTVVVDETVSIDLNGKTITGSQVLPVIRIKNGATATVKNGNITNNDGYIFILGESGSITSGNLTIEGGKYHGATSVASVTYGTLTILDGEFSVEPYQGSYAYLINCIDANYSNKTAKVAIQGGYFHNWNPENNAAEGEGTNFCALGYEAVTFDGENYFVFEKDTTVQSTSLTAGWTWTSFFVDATFEALKDELGTNGRQIKTQASGFTTYNVNTDKWSGSLRKISADLMYMIKVENAQVINLEAYPVNPSDYEYELYPNWTWISFPSENSISVTDALADVNPVVGDRIKGQDGYAQYTSAGKWQGTLKTLVPGKGYMYQNSTSEIKTLVYPETNGNRGEAPANITAANNLMVPNMSKYANNMNITAVVNIDGEELMTEDFEVAVFAGEELRGSARPIYIESLNRYMLFITVYGEESEELTFKYYDLNSGEELNLFADSKVVFEINSVIGSVEQPSVLSYGTLSIDETSASSFNIYPNPTTRDRAINLQATCDNVEVFNALGVKIAEYQNVDTIDALETAGVYVIRVTINGEVKNCRLVVK